MNFSSGIRAPAYPNRYFALSYVFEGFSFDLEEKGQGRPGNVREPENPNGRKNLEIQVEQKEKFRWTPKVENFA